MKLSTSLKSCANTPNSDAQRNTPFVLSPLGGFRTRSSISRFQIDCSSWQSRISADCRGIGLGGQVRYRWRPEALHVVRVRAGRLQLPHLPAGPVWPQVATQGAPDRTTSRLVSASPESRYHWSVYHRHERQSQTPESFRRRVLGSGLTDGRPVVRNAMHEHGRRVAFQAKFQQEVDICHSAV